MGVLDLDTPKSVSTTVDKVTDTVSSNVANVEADIKGYESDFTKSASLIGGKKRRAKGKKVKKTVRKTHGKKHNKKHSKKSRKLSKSLSSWIMHVKKFAKDHKIKYPEAMKHPKCKATFKKH